MDTITCPTYFENCFTSDEIQEILNLQNVFELKQSKITSTHIIDYRISENFWIPKNNVKYKWIYDRLIKYISIANKSYKFNLILISPSRNVGAFLLFFSSWLYLYENTLFYLI